MRTEPLGIEWDQEEEDEAITEVTSGVRRAGPVIVTSMRGCLARLLRPWIPDGGPRQVLCSFNDSPLVQAPPTTLARVYENVLLNALATVDAVPGSVRVTVEVVGNQGVLLVDAGPQRLDGEQIGLEIARTLVDACGGSFDYGLGDDRAMHYRVALPLAPDKSS